MVTVTVVVAAGVRFFLSFDWPGGSVRPWPLFDPAPLLGAGVVDTGVVVAVGSTVGAGGSLGTSIVVPVGAGSELATGVSLRVVPPLDAGGLDTVAVLVSVELVGVAGVAGVVVGAGVGVAGVEFFGSFCARDACPARGAASGRFTTGAAAACTRTCRLGATTCAGAASGRARTTGCVRTTGWRATLTCRAGAAGFDRS